MLCKVRSMNFKPHSSIKLHQSCKYSERRGHEFYLHNVKTLDIYHVLDDPQAGNPTVAFNIGYSLSDTYSAYHR